MTEDKKEEIIIPTPTKEELELADQEISIAVLCTGQRSDGKDFWAYLMVPPSKFEAYKEAEQKGDFNLDDYGLVLFSGEGLEPPDEVKQAVEKGLGLMHDFEERVIDGVKRVYKEELLEKYGGKKKPETK